MAQSASAVTSIVISIRNIGSQLYAFERENECSIFNLKSKIVTQIRN